MVLFTSITADMATSLQENSRNALTIKEKSKQACNNDSVQDWQIGKNVLECNKYMFENSIQCDVTFTFQPSDKIKKSMGGHLLSAHKYVLISRSPVFYAMFCGPAKDESGLVTIEDIDIASFTEILR